MFRFTPPSDLPNAPADAGPRAASRRLAERRRSARRRRGGTMLEFAVVFPVLFILFIGSTQIFRFSMVANALETCAIEGAREGSLPGREIAAAEETAARLFRDMGYEGGQFTGRRMTTDGREYLVMRGTINLRSNRFVLPALGGIIELRRECKVRIEGS